MTAKDIATILLSQTHDLSVTEVTKVVDLKDLTERLTLIQLSPTRLVELDYSKRRKEFADVFAGYDPSAVAKNHRYLRLLDKVIDHFAPERESPYKEITQAVFGSARFLAPYPDLKAFEKDLYEACLNDDKTEIYLENFRMLSHLSSLYFNKASLFFQQTGLLDIPVADASAKAFLLKTAAIDGTNHQIAKKLIAIAKAGKMSGAELNQRMDVALTKE